MSVPATVVLDNFDRGGEDPLSFAGQWSPWTPLTNTARMLISSLDTIVTSWFDGNGTSSYYWNPETFGPDCEVYIQVYSSDSTFVSSQLFLGLRMSTPGNTAWNGYYVVIAYDGIATNNIRFYVYRSDSGVYTYVDSYTAAGLGYTPGDQFTARLVGSTFSVYKNGTLIYTFGNTDSTYSSAGYIGFGSNANNYFNDFGGGSLGGISYSLQLSGSNYITSGNDLTTRSGGPRLTLRWTR